jgi:hypothetical protein
MENEEIKDNDEAKERHPMVDVIVNWFVNLPVWAEIDNYFYFAIAIYCLGLGGDKIEDKVIYGFMGTIIGAAIMKGKGK